MNQKKTKIICTVGPACLDGGTLRRMVQAGMNGARINTAYGDLDHYNKIIDAVRGIADIPVILDIKGPEIRLKVKGKRSLKKGQVLEIGFKDEPMIFSRDFHEAVNVDDTILIDNGKLKMKVAAKRKNILSLIAANSGELENGKGVNIPNKTLKVPTLSDADKQVVELAEKKDVEFIALSFTRNAQDIQHLRKEAHECKGAIIAKIENREGVDNFDEILDAADGIMVARGDLGVEIEPEKVPLVQKSIIKKCNQRGKIVVTATEMLESMMHSPVPTRAEVSDVANAILDGTEATMLSGETAVGKHPVESVMMMSRIAVETEKAIENHVEDEGYINISDTISRAIQRICQEMPLDKIITLTRSGYTARMISRFKTKQPIIAVTPDALVKRQLELTFGVIPVNIDYQKKKDRILEVAGELRDEKLISDKDTVLFTAAFRTTQKHASNLIEIHNLKEFEEFTNK